MYCPNCGKPEQTPDTYCRACGEFLTSPTTGSRIVFGGNTPQEKLQSINILSLIAAVSSLAAGLWMYVTFFNNTIALYVGASILLCNAFWHMTNFIIGMKLQKRLGKGKEMPSEEFSQLPEAKTKELLQPASMSDATPLSVTDETTRQLADKVRR